ncbi:PAAR domain-containing protein, partial [Pseudomonas sp. Ant30-3]|uniref:PAAR domain-containing protein n=1 Tax=Pseudomonas sp. Ant30-3 TaxID=1488328 RepID=UPI0015A54EA2
MISSARLSDKHVCPLPGHGTTPIASASADTNINFMGSARVGDTCGCGAVITTGFPSIQVNGRPMAHLGSPTSHGGTIITGSGDVGGGFVMGDAGG